MIEYKDIQLGKKIYRVGTDGSVFDIKRNKVQKLGILGFGITGFGYDNEDGVHKQISVAKLVAIAFLGHTSAGSKIVVSHKNGIKSDNRLDNIIIINSKQNLDNRGEDRKVIDND